MTRKPGWLADARLNCRRWGASDKQFSEQAGLELWDSEALNIQDAKGADYI
jgi:hypothetical protein